MESQAAQGGCLNYMYNCYKSMKEKFHDYQAYANGFDQYQRHRHAVGSDFKDYYCPPMVTHSMERLLKAQVRPEKRLKTMAGNLLDNVTHTFAYGAFALANLVVTEKKYVEDFFTQNICPKKNSSYDDQDKYYDAYDADILTRAIYISPEGRQYPPLKRPLEDDPWCFINDDLSVQLKNTNPPPKPPRRVMTLRK